MAKKLPFELQPGETLLRDEMSTWIHGTFSARLGRLYLTNHRLIFAKQNPFLLPLFGIFGFLFERFFAGANKVAFETSLREISTFEQTQNGINKKVVLLHTAQGDQKFGFTRPYEEWETALKTAMRK